MNCYRVLSGQCLCLICSDMMTSCLDRSREKGQHARPAALRNPGWRLAGPHFTAPGTKNSADMGYRDRMPWRGFQGATWHLKGGTGGKQRKRGRCEQRPDWRHRPQVTPPGDSPPRLVSTFWGSLGLKARAEGHGRQGGEGIAHGGQGAQVAPRARKEKQVASPHHGGDWARERGHAPERGLRQALNMFSSKF